APVAGNDSFITHSEYIAIASNLTYNDSDPDDDEFHISSLAHGGTVADFDEEFGAYTVQGIYGTLLLFPYETSSVTIGGFVNTHFNAGDFIFVTGKAINGDSLGDLPIYDLQPGQMPPLSDTFTYTVADSHGAESLEAAAITLTFEPSYANLRVQTADGYDTTTLRDDLKYGIITDIDSTCVTVQNGGRTILIDAKELTWSGTVEEENVTLTGGLIKGFHVSDSSVPVFDAVRFNIPAADLDEAVGNSTSTAFDDTLKEYAYDSLGGSGPDVFRGGDLADYIDTGGGADTVTAGNGNDVVTIRDNTAWKIDGGAGIDTIRLDGAFNLTASPEEQNATSIEIVDLKNNSAYANTIVVEPEGVFQINGDHVVRILGTATDTVVLGHDYPGGVGGHWVSGQTEMTYTADYVTQGVLFDRYDYMDVEDQTYATLYVQHGVTVDDGPVVLSENLQTVEGPNGGATVSQLSIADGDVGAALSFTVEAGDGTLALALENEAITLDQDGSNGTLSGTGSLAAINQMLADGVTYAPDLDTPPVTDMVTLTFTDGQGSDTLNFIFNVTGENPVLFGTANKDILYATEGDDQFVFAATTGTGHDTIINFTPGHDDIELDYEAFTTASGPNDFSHWLASHATAVNGDVLIDLNIDGEHLNQDTILLKNVALASLHANDFILSPGGGNVL
ncbi:MAG: hypothetical protein JWR80_6204, partial [Bradyrhizobium sp.]|nr:hypothetical protein [Bradyrhizobium sp.]